MNQYQRYFVFDDPIPYKKLLLYPVRIRDYYEFLSCASCLMLEKNSIRDPAMAVKAISMSYLEYMYFISTKENNFVLLFKWMMSIVLNKRDEFNMDIGYDKNEKPFFEINGEIYNSDDFDQLRQIIAEQNSLELPDETIQKIVRDKMEEARRLKAKINQSKTASFEEQLVALGLYTGWDLEKIYNLTIRKFIMGIQRANHMIMSNIYLTASLSGFVTFKNKDVQRGWLADLSSDNKYNDVTMSLDSITKKVSGEEAKNKNQ